MKTSINWEPQLNCSLKLRNYVFGPLPNFFKNESKTNLPRSFHVFSMHKEKSLASKKLKTDFDKPLRKHH